MGFQLNTNLNLALVLSVLQIVNICSCLDRNYFQSWPNPPEASILKKSKVNNEFIIFDDSPGLGRIFQGVGAISGGGATSKLLVNYEKTLRDQILDYLFKPNFGASLHILKVEVGGDMQSTDGSEASHMHNSWDENYNRGYEWWIMKEAKKRNPNIKLYGLPWGFPGWIGQGILTPYVAPEITADYVIKWISGAKTAHNLTIDYIGIWNEHPYCIKYIKTLRKMLDSRGFENTMIIGSDAYWEIVPDIIKDKSLANIIYAIGTHYPGTNSPLDAKKTGKALWASEDYSTFNDEVGAGCWARTLNQNYVNGLLTSTIAWNLIGSYYEHLPWFRTGLMTAVHPWSGHYTVSTPIWVSAHTTQFVSIGWIYLSHKSGVGKLPAGGSYVSLTNEAKDQLTIVIETMTHNHSICTRPPLPEYNVSPQNITITLKGSFAGMSHMNVWYSKLGFHGAEDQMFVEKEPLVFKNGQATLSLGLDEIFTLTTLTTGKKGSYSKPPEPQSFPLPYKDSFEDLKISQEPFNLVPQVGCFEIVKSEDVSHGLVTRQVVLQPPIESCPWPHDLHFPMAIIGDYNWMDIAVEVEFDIPKVNGTKGIFVAARVTKGSCLSSSALGIFFYVFPETGKFIVSHDLARKGLLMHGQLTIGPGWHKISVVVSGTKCSGFIDSKKIFNLEVPKKPSNGWAAIGTDGFGYADFDNLSINQTKPPKI